MITFTDDGKSRLSSKLPEKIDCANITFITYEQNCNSSKVGVTNFQL
jgi:hypothetical protein